MIISYLPPLSLYIHFPWCVKKCPYCDFNSHSVKQNIPESAYIDALLLDLEQQLPSIWGRSISSIFIGGGTPSLMSAEGLDRLLCGIRARLPFLADTEVTMEANPGTFEAEKFAEFYSAGVNRLSIGVQSFSDPMLKRLGRIHSAEEAIKAFHIARDAGFNNINIDLMYGLPGQSIEQALQDLSSAIKLSPEHLSWYQLTLEPNTLFASQPPKQMPAEDSLIDFSDSGISLLTENNYQRYEISAFSKNAKNQCWHNINYWQFGDYLAIGAGAHSKITRADTQQITRTNRKRNPKDYLATEQFIQSEKTLSPSELPLEFMMNAMRLKQGVERGLFSQVTGLSDQIILPIVNKLIKAELLKIKDNYLMPTATGFNYLNEILIEFMPENFSKLDASNKINIKQL